MPTKFDQSTTASRKALALFGVLLFSRHPHSLKQLAERLSCSRQTILRLLDEIEQTNAFTIRKWKDGTENMYQATVPNMRPNIQFSQEELLQLLLCRDLVKHILPKEQQLLLGSATDKATCFVDDAAMHNSLPESLGQGVVKGQIDYARYEDVLQALIAGRNSAQVLEIAYLAHTRTEPKTHAFVPMRLVSYHDGLYVRGWKVSANGRVDIVNPMTLALHRMKEIWPTCRFLAASAQKERPFPEESGYFGMAEQAPPFRVVVRFFPPATGYVQERIWSTDQSFEEDVDEALRLTFTAQSELEVVKWVLSFGAEAELLAPEHLRLRVSDELKTASSRYGA